MHAARHRAHASFQPRCMCLVPQINAVWRFSSSTFFCTFSSLSPSLFSFRNSFGARLHFHVSSFCARLGCGKKEKTTDCQLVCVTHTLFNLIFATPNSMFLFIIFSGQHVFVHLFSCSSRWYFNPCSSLSTKKKEERSSAYYFSHFPLVIFFSGDGCVYSYDM